MKQSILSGLSTAVFFGFIVDATAQSRILHQTDDFTVSSDGVQQGQFTAKALSRTALTSNYQSPQNGSVSSIVEFKFSINRKDNEMKPGVNHLFNLASGAKETPLIEFGQPTKPQGKSAPLGPDTPLKIRLDLRKVLAELKSKGYFTTFNGDKIYKDDFKHVYVAGAAAPLSWDFDNLHQVPELELKDNDGDGIYETNIVLNAKKDQKKTDGSWTQSRNTSAFAQYRSPDVLADALYNLALEEMVNAVEPDSTFRTGKEWAGVWTRDISYSIILSMAHLQPKVALNSLMRKVNAQKRIIQDTGTGGAYPCSTDRMIWATAAWEVYKATGDRKWLESAYEIVKNSIDDDIFVAYDETTGLVRGESSFLDWREQTYPKWMQPADIYASQNLGTNAVHYQANTVLSQMAQILGKTDVAQKHQQLADQIKKGINRYLWLPEKGYYAQYRYGRHAMMVSPRSEALGEALCVLFGIADEARAKQIVASIPQTAYGITCIYPQIPGLPPYHNDAVWPFVQSYWALASGKVKNTASVMESIAAVYRPAALFLTNKENFVAGNGDFAGTVINSSNMLWSLSGSLALVQKLLFGIRFEADKLRFEPFVPKALEGTRSLTNFTYRGATLDITLIGYGDVVESFRLDGKSAVPEISASTKGKHTIEITLKPSAALSDKINKKPNVFAPATPLVTEQDRTLTWSKVDGAVVYQIVRDGKVIDQTKGTELVKRPQGFDGEYQIIAVDASGVTSFASEPVSFYPKDATTLLEIERTTAKANYDYKGFSGDGFVETSKTVNRSITFTIDIASAGTYVLDFRYANGNGPTNTENKCAIRSLNEGNQFRGTFVFPQRGVGEWSNWGWSNGVKLTLEPGKHTFQLSLDAVDENMNGAVNQAMLDQLRITRID